MSILFIPVCIEIVYIIGIEMIRLVEVVKYHVLVLWTPCYFGNVSILGICYLGMWLWCVKMTPQIKVSPIWYILVLRCCYFDNTLMIISLIFLELVFCFEIRNDKFCLIIYVLKLWFTMLGIYLMGGEQNGTSEVFDGMNMIKFYHFVIELWVILRQILSVSREIREYWLFEVNWFR